jgi:hypothetical protein
MNSFILIASLMLACCMGFVLPPLWHRAPAGADGETPGRSAE